MKPNRSRLCFFTRIIITPLLLTAVLSGCTPKFLSSNGTDFSDELINNTNTLWKIVITRGGEERFSGILVIEQHSDFISLALLDPTGITILKGDVSHSGEIRLVSNLSIIKKSKIKSYLGKAVLRIFYLSPSEDTCLKRINRLCWNQTNFTAFSEKISTIGPYILWSVSYYGDGKENERITNIEFYTPWNKTKLFLEFIS